MQRPGGWGVGATGASGEHADRNYRIKRERTKSPDGLIQLEDDGVRRNKTNKSATVPLMFMIINDIIYSLPKLIKLNCIFSFHMKRVSN